MAALTANKDVREKDSAFSQRVGDFGGGVAVDSDEFYQGQLCAFNPSTGKVVPGSTATGLIALGVCRERYTSGTGDGKVLNVTSGIFKFENAAGGDAVLAANVGADCYINDDQTVTITATGRSVAGVVYAVESDGVWVAINPLV